jgi:hypothetical protein
MHHKFQKERYITDLRMILEMIEESMALSVKKGHHPLTQGCNCIACVNKRKRILKGSPQPWRYWL